MHIIKSALVFCVIIAAGFPVAFSPSCKRNPQEGNIIFTRAEKGLQNVNYLTGENWRYITMAQIVSLDPDDPEGSPDVLTADFFSARSPEISCDGKFMLFAAQQNQNDPWQIWEMNLKNLKTRQVTTSSENCTDPVYLPGNRLLFSKLTTDGSLKGFHSLYTGNLDGTDICRITFNPHACFASTVLKDGRILTISRQMYPDQEEPDYMVLRPDGTKAELFYKSDGGKILTSRARETNNGLILFIESDTGDLKESNLVSVSYNRPVHSLTNHTSEISGSFHSVYPMSTGTILVSYRESETDRYALYEFDPARKDIGTIVCSLSGFDLLEPVVVEEYNRPKKLPSEVDTGVKTGLLLCQDINFLGFPSSDNTAPLPAADRIEVIGIDSSLGVVRTEKDGSFYLKVMADKPFRIQTVDKNGRVLNGPCDWIWLRPNERRGCVGCHEDPGIVPENRVPLSVLKEPVTMPVHITKGKEKDIELE